MSTSDPFLPSQPGQQSFDDGPGSGPTEAELERDRDERPDPEGDGPTDEGLPPMMSTPIQKPDGESVDPADILVADVAGAPQDRGVPLTCRCRPQLAAE